MIMDTQTKSVVHKAYPEKDAWSHKNEYGKLLVVAGSAVFTGAPVTVGMAAMRSGVDNVYFIGPKRAMHCVANAFPTFVNKALECDYIGKENVEQIFDFAEEMKVTGLVIGPGLWRKEQTRKAILDIIEGFEIPMVVDADAIRAMQADNKLLSGKTSIITPHSNEFKELTGVEPSMHMEERAKTVRDWAKVLGTTIVLKGHVDVVSNGEHTALNKTGNVYMTKGGFGDTLAGICGALISRRKNKLDAYDAACAATYINGRAGDIAAKESYEGLLVTDMIHRIPEVIKES